MKKNLLLAFIGGVSCWCVEAQEINLSLEALFNLAETNNSELKASTINVEVAKQGIEVAKAAKLPDITASLDLSFIGDGTVLDRDFTNAMRDKLPHFGNTLSLNVYQPLYTGGAIAGGIEMAQANSLMANINLDQTRAGIRFGLAQKYLNLFKMYNLVKVYEENIEVTRRLIENMRARHQQGTVLKNDITRFELRLSSLSYDLSSVKNTISILNRDLTSELSLDPQVIIIPDTTIIQSLMDTETEYYWQELAKSNSNELKAVDTQKSIAETSLKISKAEYYPTIGLFAADNLSGPVTFEIPAINKNYNFWTIGVSINYKLSSLFKTNKTVIKNKINVAYTTEMRTTVEEALQRKIHEAYILSVQAQQMLDTETTNLALATENYRIVDARFTNDMALLTDMLDAATAKLDAETRLVNARISTLIAIYQLKYISGTL